MFLIPQDFWQVKKTAHKGLGVFAAKKLKRGTVIGDYLGKVIKTSEYDFTLDKNGLFLMYYSDAASVYPDLTIPGIHLINHSCSPNCWIYTYHGHTLFFALRNIKAGEELTISYLLSPKTGFCHPCPHVCRCQSKNCTGSMHLSSKKFAIWQAFQDKQTKITRRARVVFGQNLPPLSKYPKSIPIDPVYSRITNSL